MNHQRKLLILVNKHLFDNLNYIVQPVFSNSIMITFVVFLLYLNFKYITNHTFKNIKYKFVFIIQLLFFKFLVSNIATKEVLKIHFYFISISCSTMLLYLGLVQERMNSGIIITTNK